MIMYEWSDDIEESEDIDSASDVVSQEGSLSTEIDIDTEDVTLDTVCFKCVGVTREPSCQKL